MATEAVSRQIDPDYLGLDDLRRRGFYAGNLRDQTVPVHRLLRPIAAISARHHANVAHHRRHRLDVVADGFGVGIHHHHHHRLVRDRQTAVRHHLLLEEANATYHRLRAKAPVVHHHRPLQHLSIMASAARLSCLFEGARSPLPARHRRRLQELENAALAVVARVDPDMAVAVLELAEVAPVE